MNADVQSQDATERHSGEGEGHVKSGTTSTTLQHADAVETAARPVTRRRRRISLLALVSLPFIMFFALPLLALVLRVSPADVVAGLGEQEVRQAISLSLTTTLLTVVITVLFGTPLAYLLARRRFAGRTVVDTLIDLPMVLPPAVAGIALLVTFGRRGLLGQYLEIGGLEIAFTQTAVVLAQTFVAAPFYIKTALGAFSNLNRDLEEAAALDGASSQQTFHFVTLPLTLPVLFGGAMMTWARALGEFGATIIFAGNFPGRTQTMPLAIYIGFEIDLRIALTLAVILLAVSFTVLLVVKGVLRQRIEAVL
ncbi:MAG: ABC transporter permease [Ktedonobacterales bacterium]